MKLSHKINLEAINLEADEPQRRRFSEILKGLSEGRRFTDRRGSGLELINLNVTFQEIRGALFLTHEMMPFSDAKYVAAQLAWYAKATQRLLGINEYNPRMWAKFTGMEKAQLGRVVDRGGSRSFFTELDLATWDLDIHSNYGEYAFKENQLNIAIDRLFKNPMSRQAVILFNRPSVQVSDTHDHICTTSLQFLVRDGRLHGITTMRSNELWNGFRYDVAFFTFLMDYVRAELNAKGRTGIQLGNYTHNVGSFHCYNELFEVWDQAQAFVFPPLKPGEGPALIRELPVLEEMIRKCPNPSPGISVLGDNTREFGHYSTIVNMLLNHESIANSGT